MNEQGTVKPKTIMVKTFRDLIVWQKAMDLIIMVYRISSGFPKDELYALTSQIRRAAVSIPSNISEGFGRHSTTDYLRFLQIALGSLYELQIQLEIAKRLKYISNENYNHTDEAAKEVERMLSAMIRKLQTKIAS